MENDRQRILILCTGNSARSQMAAAFLRSFDPGLEVYSAGTDPASRVNPNAIAAIREVGIDISAETPQNVSRFLGQPFDHVITVCGDADRNCPIFTGKVGHHVHIGFIDPAAAAGPAHQVMDTFRQVRDEIRQKLFDYYQSEIRRNAS